MSIDSIINGVLEREGEKYTNDPNDSGGPTKWGITQFTLAEFWQRAVTPEDVRTLTRTDAYNIYMQKYITRPGFDRLYTVAPEVADEVIDTAVNCGPGVATTLLQRALNAFNRQGKLYMDITVDGVCGPGTVKTLNAYALSRKDPGFKILLRALNALQGERYIDLAERRPKDEEFVFGWFSHRVVV